MDSQAIFATLALAGVCAFMWWLSRLAKRRMGVGAGTVSGSALRVVGKRPLDQKSALFVVEIAGGRHILIGSGADGSVTKVDDISPEEYARMTEDEPRVVRPKLRVAKAAGNDDAAADDDAEDDDDAAAAPQKFATVGESFGLLLNKARSRRDRPASGE
ncbi:MAG: hypothetical protein JWM98_1029 [Thermoleophilia bacterium]|nr:hypothetical protein [Thermoleophilia bacterium]